MSEQEPYKGFEYPQKNFFQMPNEWINLCADIDNLAEMKVVQYVLRHTWGFHEYGIAKAITVDEFMHGRKRVDGSRMDKGTGLKSDRSVKDGIKLAIAHGYLISEVDDSDKGRIKKSYALKMQPDEDSHHGSGRQVDTTPLEGSIYPPQTGRYYPSGVQKLPLNQVDTTPRTEKDTKERHLKKDSEEDVHPNVSPPTPMSSSSHQTEKPQQGSLIPDTKKKSGKQAEVSPQAQDIIERWMAANGGKPIPMTKALVEAAESLVDCNPSKETLICVKNFAWLNDSNGWYKKHGGVKLGDIVREYEGWQNSQQQAPPSPPPPPPAYRTNLSASNREMAARYAAKKG